MGTTPSSTKAGRKQAASGSDGLHAGPPGSLEGVPAGALGLVGGQQPHRLGHRRPGAAGPGDGPHQAVDRVDRVGRPVSQVGAGPEERDHRAEAPGQRTADRVGHRGEGGVGGRTRLQAGGQQLGRSGQVGDQDGAAAAARLGPRGPRAPRERPRALPSPRQQRRGPTTARRRRPRRSGEPARPAYRPLAQPAVAPGTARVVSRANRSTPARGSDPSSPASSARATAAAPAVTVHRPGGRSPRSSPPRRRSAASRPAG